MKKVIRTIILCITVMVFVLFCIFTESIKAQDLSTVMFNVYAQSVLYPESFDNYVQVNQNLFNQDFVSCLEQLFNRYWPAAQQRMQICNGYVDPTMRYNCIKENPAADLALWCASIAARLQGTPWCNTTSGSTLCIAKQVSESLYPGIWVSSAQPYLPMVRPFLNCQ